MFLISNMYPSSDSPGYGIFVKNVAEGLREHGIEMSRLAVITGRSGSLWGKIAKYAKFYRDVMAGFFSDYDFIYIHFPNQVMPLISLLYKIRKTKIILNFHGEDLLYSKEGFHKWLGETTRYFSKKYAAAIVVPSRYFASLTADRQFSSLKKIIVSASGGINENYFYPKSADTLKSNGRPIHIGYVGRFEPGKGILEFLEVACLLKEKNIDFHATIVGYGSLMNQTLEYISGHNLGGKVSLIPGLPQEKLADEYRKFDLLVFLSSRSEESLGLTGIEAMACGTPVIGSNVGGIASYLVDRKNGYLIEDIRDTEKLVSVIQEYSEASSEFRKSMYDEAVKTGEKYFSKTVCTQLASDLKNSLGGD